MDANLRQQVALFRYSLIAPLITNTFTQKSAKEYLAQVSAKKHSTPKGELKEYAPETLKGWLRNYRKYGFDGLYPKMRSDKGRLRKLPEDAKEFIITSKLTSPKRSAKSIYQELVVKGHVPYDMVSLSTIQRFISKADLTSKKLNPLDRRAFEFEFANDCWQSDISVGPYLTINGKKHKTYIFAFIDDATRVIIHCEAFFAESSFSLLAAFKKSVAKRGIPKRLFVDNGKVYKSDQMQFIKNITPVIIIDEAHFLKNSVLDDLRIIMNFNMDSKDYAVLILAGQIPFITQLSRQPHEALRQRIVMNYCLKGLTKEETKNYMLSRLEMAGCPEPIFTEDAFELLFSSTNGCLRTLNLLARMSLISGANQKLKSIDSEIVFQAQTELNITA